MSSSAPPGLPDHITDDSASNQMISDGNNMYIDEAFPAARQGVAQKISLPVHKLVCCYSYELKLEALDRGLLKCGIGKKPVFKPPVYYIPSLASRRIQEAVEAGKS